MTQRRGGELWTRRNVPVCCLNVNKTSQNGSETRTEAVARAGYLEWGLCRVQWRIREAVSPNLQKITERKSDNCRTTTALTSSWASRIAALLHVAPETKLVEYAIRAVRLSLLMPPSGHSMAD